jgi:putative ABC transport system permease protein
MLKNYFKVAFRNLFRNKGFSLINISGLAIGMASAMLILLWIENELSYDRFHANGHRLFEVWDNDVVGGEIKSGISTPEIMAPVLSKDVPEIEQTSRISWDLDYLLTVGDKSLKAKGCLVDASFLTMFSFPLVQGNDRTALNDPYAMVITQALAKKIFGKEDAIGKVIKVEDGENYKVTAVLKDLPNNSILNTSCPMSIKV